MNRAVLVLLDRSLRLETRSVLMCLVRVALPGLILFVLFTTAEMSRYSGIGAPGLKVFQSVMWINFFFATLLGTGYFASAITEEKEEMTLGLLCMTALSPVAILLGKSTSRLVGALLLVVVQLPFTLLAVALGGVTFLQIVAAYGALLAYMFLVCNLALVWSVVATRTSVAAIATAVSLGVFLIVPSVGLTCMSWAGVGRGAEHPWLWRTLKAMQDASPFQSLTLTLRTAASLGPVIYQVAANVVLGVAAFLLAWALFDRCTRDQKEASQQRPLLFRRSGRSMRVPARVVGASALAWKETWIMGGGRWEQVLKVFVIGVLHAMVAFAPLVVGGSLEREYVGGSLMITALIFLGVALVVDASRVFKEEVRWKTLSNLVILPIELREVAYRKVAGCLKGTLPVVAFLVLGALIYPEGVVSAVTGLLKMDVAGFGVMTLMLCQSIFFVHLVAYLSLVVKRGALPLAVALQYVGVMLAAMTTPGFVRDNAEVVIGFWVLVTVGLVVLLHYGVGKRLAEAAGEA